MLNKNSANSTVGGVSGVNKQVVSKRVARLNHLGEDTSNYDCNGDRIHSHGMEENGPSNYSLNMLANPGLKKPKTV